MGTKALLRAAAAATLLTTVGHLSGSPHVLGSLWPRTNAQQSNDVYLPEVVVLESVRRRERLLAEAQGRLVAVERDLARLGYQPRLIARNEHAEEYPSFEQRLREHVFLKTTPTQLFRTKLWLANDVIKIKPQLQVPPWQQVRARVGAHCAKPLATARPEVAVATPELVDDSVRWRG